MHSQYTLMLFEGQKVVVNSADSMSSTIKLSVYRQIEGNKHSELSIYVSSFPGLAMTASCAK